MKPRFPYASLIALAAVLAGLLAAASSPPFSSSTPATPTDAVGTSPVVAALAATVGALMLALSAACAHSAGWCPRLSGTLVMRLRTPAASPSSGTEPSLADVPLLSPPPAPVATRDRTH